MDLLDRSSPWGRVRAVTMGAIFGVVVASAVLRAGGVLFASTVASGVAGVLVAFPLGMLVLAIKDAIKVAETGSLSTAERSILRSIVGRKVAKLRALQVSSLAFIVLAWCLAFHEKLFPWLDGVWLAITAFIVLTGCVGSFVFTLVRFPEWEFERVDFANQIRAREDKKKARSELLAKLPQSVTWPDAERERLSDYKRISTSSALAPKRGRPEEGE
jgi:hypothetical protein